MSHLISIDELKAATGCTNVADIEKCLQKNGIRVAYGKKSYLFTTLDAVNKALGIGGNDDHDKIELL